MTDRLTVLFLGDSFVAGVGDPTGLGWTTRLVAGSRRPTGDLTTYPLGIRRNTSLDVLERWERETVARLPGVGRAAVVLSFGVNDATDGDDGARRVSPDDSVRALRRIVERAVALDLSVLFVGPPPIADDRITARVVELDALLCAEARALGATAVSVVADLRADPAWTREVRDGDGAHPGVAGYARLAELVRPAWHTWTETVRVSRSRV